MAKAQFGELIPSTGFSTRLGSGSTDQLPNATYDDKEVGKFVKLSAGSRYQLAAVGDSIEGYIGSTEPASIDGYCFGTVYDRGRKRVTLDGLQATPGTGVVAVGDAVVVGTVVAKGTALSGPARVCKMTDPTTVAGVLAVAVKPIWRVVEIFGASGTPGTTALIERVNAGGSL
jgi:hypothetical protein